MTREEAAAIEATVRACALRLKPGIAALACGSYRRAKNTCGDVDVLIAYPAGDGDCDILHALVTQLKKDGFLTDHLSMSAGGGDDARGRAHARRSASVAELFRASNAHVAGHCDTYMGVCAVPQRSDARRGGAGGSGGASFGGVHRRLDIKVYPFKQFAFAVMYFTGSDHFNRSMRYYAKQKGWTLSDNGLSPAVRKDGVKIAEGASLRCETEEEVFWALGMTYIKPQLRDEAESVRKWFNNSHDGGGGGGGGGASLE